MCVKYIAPQEQNRYNSKFGIFLLNIYNIFQIDNNRFWDNIQRQYVWHWSVQYIFVFISPKEHNYWYNFIYGSVFLFFIPSYLKINIDGYP